LVKSITHTTKKMHYTAKIDVTKIDKAHLYRGKFLDLVLWENRDGPGQYGDTHMIIQSLSKEDRAAGKRGAIVGNLRPMEVKGGAKFKPEPKNDTATYDFRAGDVPF
jgi:hypothetical protein